MKNGHERPSRPTLVNGNSYPKSGRGGIHATADESRGLRLEYANQSESLPDQARMHWTLTPGAGVVPTLHRLCGLAFG